VYKIMRRWNRLFR